jgi:outer membrane cobalamin receptor
LGAESHLSAAISYQYLDTLTTQFGAGDRPRIDDNSVGYSRSKGVLTLNYDNRGFDYQFQLQYLGSANVENNAPANAYSIQRYSPVAYINMAVTYDLTRTITLRASVDNVLDTKPPYPYPLNGTSNPNSNPQATYFTGVLGTYIRVGAAAHF